jgi:hypothetical protein
MSINLQVVVDSEVVRPHHDLGTQLIGRKERLSWLIRFINDNAVLGKVCFECFCNALMFGAYIHWIDVAEQSTEAGY